MCSILHQQYPLRLTKTTPAATSPSPSLTVHGRLSVASATSSPPSQTASSAPRVPSWSASWGTGSGAGRSIISLPPRRWGGADAKAQMEEVVSVVLWANRVRRSVLVDIMSATIVYQAMLFLEGLAQFLIGFRE
ncbi:Protein INAPERTURATE [Vigna angularis]|uniref:Protein INAPERTURATE n=1 Tax=Phaseolus angularis TaxID=3914 RepID=A0A8T0KX26_PHAAN|nr:Protein INAPERTURATE [Vigna angularis]